MRLVAVIALVIACQAKPVDDELDEARARVRGLFDAVTRGDCAAIGAVVPAAATPEACDKLLHEWRDDLRLSLIEIAEVQRDGRDRRAIIVRTTVMRRAQQQTMLLRVMHENGRWQVAL